MPLVGASGRDAVIEIGQGKRMFGGLRRACGNASGRKRGHGACAAKQELPP
ncbi:hypothetical protein QW131_22815 [Roseibium salinum]|nr:hypothetical protein [Roseibium salinum]